MAVMAKSGVVQVICTQNLCSALAPASLYQLHPCNCPCIIFTPTIHVGLSKERVDILNKHHNLDNLATESPVGAD